MNILVTGAAGFIGSHLAEHLLSLGHTVRGVDCLTDFYPLSHKTHNEATLTAKGATCLRLDLAADDLSEAVAGIELVYHLAAQPGLSATTGFEAYLRNNVVATHALLEAVTASRTLRGFVNISTSSVYGADATQNETAETKPTSHYGVTKLAAEQLVLAYARERRLPACSLRLFSVYGARERPEKLFPQLIRAMLEDREFELHEGSEQHARSFTYVGDIVDGMVAVHNRLEQCSGEIFNIGTDTATTTGDAIRIVENIIGKPAKVRRTAKRVGDQLRTCADIAKARRILGYNPIVTPEVGLRHAVEWFRRHALQVR